MWTDVNIILKFKVKKLTLYHVVQILSQSKVMVDYKGVAKGA